MAHGLPGWSPGGLVQSGRQRDDWWPAQLMMNHLPSPRAAAPRLQWHGRHAWSARGHRHPRTTNRTGGGGESVDHETCLSVEGRPSYRGRVSCCERRAARRAMRQPCVLGEQGRRAEDKDSHAPAMCAG